jgi:predicted HNH restriction endonuclease
MPSSTNEDNALERAYPRHERKAVRSHLRRDRSPMLALACKQRDKYRCQCCRRRMEEFYGDLGQEFAECHHTVPLSTLKEGVLTRLDDLITVCPNCHRILHKMDGVPEDVEALREVLRKRRGRRHK